MSSSVSNGGKKEWVALGKVYEYLYSTYPDFQRQVDESGFSTIESNEKGELILEIDRKDSDIVVDSDKIIKAIKKAGIKRFSEIGSLTLDKILEYDYDMAKGLLNILVRRGKGRLSLNLHFYYIEGESIPKVKDFIKRNGDSDWSDESKLGDFTEIFIKLLLKPLEKEGIFWIHMVEDVLKISVISNGEIVESFEYGKDSELDDKINKFMGILSEMYEHPVKEIFLLSDEISKVRYRKNDDGEISVSVY